MTLSKILLFSPATLFLCLQVLQVVAFVVPAPSSVLSERQDSPSAKLEARWSPKNSTVLYAEGTFGPKGLLGSHNPDGSKPAAAAVQSDTSSPSIYQDVATNPIYCLYHSCPWQIFWFGGFWGTLLGGGEKKQFQNNDAINWPMSRTDGTLWAMRIFTDNSCGNYGAKPSDSLIAEYHGASFGYQNKKPCQNYMVSGDKKGKTQAKSTAVWLDQSVSNGLILTYSSPVCEADERQTKDSGDNTWTVASTPTSPFQNYVSIYNGTGQVTNHQGSQKGAWVCFPFAYNAFSVVAVGSSNMSTTANGAASGTDMTIPDGYYNASGQISLASTVPADLPGTQAFFKQKDLFTQDLSALAKTV